MSTLKLKKLCFFWVLIGSFLVSFRIEAQEDSNDGPPKAPDLTSIVHRISRENAGVNTMRGAVHIVDTHKDGRLDVSLSNTAKVTHFYFKNGEYFQSNIVFIPRWGFSMYQRSEVADHSRYGYKLNLIGDRFTRSWSYYRRYDQEYKVGDPMFALLTYRNDAGIVSSLPLIKYNLFPKILLSFRHQIEITTEQQKEEEYIVLTLKRLLSRNHQQKNNESLAKQKMYINPDTYRIEKINTIPQKTGWVDNHTRTVTAFRNVEGSKLPSRVKIEQTNVQYGYVGTLEYEFLEVNKGTKDKSKMEDRSWLYAPELPELTDTSLSELKRKLEGNGGKPSLYLGVKNGVLMRRLGLMVTPLDIVDFTKAIERHPKSRLFYNALGVSYWSKEQREKLEQLYASVQKRGIKVPLLQLLLCEHLIRERKFERAREVIEPLSDHPPYRKLAKSMSKKIIFNEASTQKAFRTSLANLLPHDSFRENLNFLRTVEPPPQHDLNIQYKGFLARKGMPFIKKLAEHSRSNELDLLLARAAVNLEQFDEAQKLYQRVPLTEQVRREIMRVIHKIDIHVKTDFVPLILPHLEHSGVLYQFIKQRLDQGNTEKVPIALRRYVNVIEQADPSTESVGNSEALLEIIEFCQKREFRNLEKRFIRQIVRHKCDLLENKKFRTHVKQVYGTDRKKLYRLIRHSEDLYCASEMYPIDELLKRLARRIRKDQYDQADVQFKKRIFKSNSLDSYVTEPYSEDPDELREHRKRFSAIGTLLGAIEKHLETNQPTLERLGDWHFVKENYRKAAKYYRRLLNRVVEQKRQGNYSDWIEDRYDSQMGLEDWLDPEEENDFSPNFPLEAKLAISHEKAGMPRTGAEQILRYSKQCNMSKNNDYLLICLDILNQPEFSIDLLRVHFKKLQKRELDPARYDGIIYEWVRYLSKKRKYIHGIHLLNYGMGLVEKDERKGLRAHRRRILKKVDTDRFIRTYVFNLNQKNVKENEKENVSKLIKQLGVKSYEKRKEAIRQLREMGEEVIPYLFRAKDSNNPEIRKSVKHLLLEYGTKQLGTSKLPGTLQIPDQSQKQKSR